MGSDVWFTRGPKKVRVDDEVKEVQVLKIGFKLQHDKFNTKVREATPEDIEAYPAEYQLWEVTDGNTVGLEDLIARQAKEIRELKEKLLAFEKKESTPTPVEGAEAELILEEEPPKKGKR